MKGQMKMHKRDRRGRNRMNRSVKKNWFRQKEGSNIKYTPSLSHSRGRVAGFGEISNDLCMDTAQEAPMQW
jgi:hypothetical protein